MISPTGFNQRLKLSTALTAMLLALSACAGQPHSAKQESSGTVSGKLQQVASFDHQVTGVTIAQDGRVFFSFPRWTEDAPLSVAEVKDGKITPYPNAEWNAWRNTRKSELSPADHFVCVQSVVADKQGHLWVVDPAAPGNERIVKGGPKLVRIDLATNSVSKVIPFDDKAAPTASYLNDVRISPDGKTAYLTDSGKGAIVVVDLQTGKARRVLEGHPSTQAESNVIVHADGFQLRRPDGRSPEFNSDGIALSPDGETLYWQALTGKTLYKVSTALLRSPKTTKAALEKAVQKVGENGVADGLLIDRQGTMFITSPEDDSVKQRALSGSSSPHDPAVFVQDSRLRWPDTLSEGPDGSIYVTASHIQDSPWFKPGADKAVKTELYKLVR